MIIDQNHNFSQDLRNITRRKKRNNHLRGDTLTSLTETNELVLEGMHKAY